MLPTQSTVSDPVQPPPGAPGAIQNPIQQDFAREQETLKKLGISNPLQIANLDETTLYEMTYTPDELANFPHYQELMALKQGKSGAMGELLATPKPTTSMMKVLEEALKAKTDVGKQQLGTSDLYKQAGLGGYAVLNQSLAEKGKEMKAKYTSFVNQLSTVSSSLKDTYNTIADKYKLLSDAYEQEQDKFSKIIDSLVAHEQAIELLNKRHQNDLELAKLKSSFSGGAGGFTPPDAEEAETPEWMLKLVDRFKGGESQGSLNTVIDNMFSKLKETEYYQTMLDNLLHEKQTIEIGEKSTTFPEGFNWTTASITPPEPGQKTMETKSIAEQVTSQKKMAAISSPTYLQSLAVWLEELGVSEADQKAKLSNAMADQKNIKLTSSELNALYAKIKQYMP